MLFFIRIFLKEKSTEKRKRIKQYGKANTFFYRSEKVRESGN